MRKRRRLEITVEHEEVFAVRESTHGQQTWCPGCGAAVDVLTLEAVSAPVARLMREVMRDAGIGLGHLVETTEGRLLLCPRALHQLSENAVSSIDQPDRDLP